MAEGEASVHAEEADDGRQTRAAMALLALLAPSPGPIRAELVMSDNGDDNAAEEEESISRVESDDDGTGTVSDEEDHSSPPPLSAGALPTPPSSSSASSIPSLLELSGSRVVRPMMVSRARQGQGGVAAAVEYYRRRRRRRSRESSTRGHRLHDDGPCWLPLPPLLRRTASFGALVGALLALCIVAAYVATARVLLLWDGSSSSSSPCGGTCAAGSPSWASVGPRDGEGGAGTEPSSRWGGLGSGGAWTGANVWRRLARMGAINPEDEEDGIMGIMYDDAPPSREELDRRRRRDLQTSPSSSFSSSSSSSSSASDSTTPESSASGEEDKSGPKLVIAGKMTVEEGQCNVAQMNLETNEWSLTQRLQLSLYNSYSGGEVYSMLPNNTLPIGAAGRGSGDDDDEDPKHRSSSSKVHSGGGDLLVVGAFDTTYRNSQVTYCSVGKWDGDILSKVGEGLCNSALSKGMKITCAALAGPHDIYVAGSFHTQVWNGDSHEFVKIFNIAHYNAIEQVWMPLPVGQLTCSWCTVTVLSLAWDSKRNQLHVGGKFNAIDGGNIPAGLAIYDRTSGHLVAHPGGGLAMKNITQDGVATSLQLDGESGVLYVMGSFNRLTATGEYCAGLAAYEIDANHWTCLADAAHSVLPSGGGNMLLTPFGLMVAGKTTSKTTWPDSDRPYTIALLKTTLKSKQDEEPSNDDDDDATGEETVMASSLKRSSGPQHEFNWSWLPGFDGWMEPIHTLANGFGDYEGVVFIGGDNLVAKWFYQTKTVPIKPSTSTGSHTSFVGRRDASSTSQPTTKTVRIPLTVDLSTGHVRGVIMAISQLNPPDMTRAPAEKRRPSVIGYTIVVYCVALGALFGMLLALLCNRNLNSTIVSYFFERDAHMKGISLDTLTYSAVENTNVAEAYQRAMRTRFVQHPHLLTLIDPQEIILHRIIGEGTFGRVWSARWRTSSVAVKEFVFAQAAVAGRSSQQNEIIEEIIGEAGMMAILRHPNVLQLFGCSLTAQAIWIVSELCSMGSLRQLLDDQERELPWRVRVNLALQVAEGMTYLHTQDPPIIHRDLKSHNILCHETFTETDWEKTKNKKKTKKGSSRSRSKSGEEKKTTCNGRDANASAAQAGGGKMTSESTIVAKIGDWGSARATLAGSRTMTHGVGTACWLAPEVITHARSSKFSDVYGFGIILWELATREEVYQGLESTQIIARVANDNLRPHAPDGCPWKDLMVQCWSENPKDRPSFEQIVKDLSKLAEKLPPDDKGSKKDMWSGNSYSTYQRSS